MERYAGTKLRQNFRNGIPGWVILRGK